MKRRLQLVFDQQDTREAYNLSKKSVQFGHLCLYHLDRRDNQIGAIHFLFCKCLQDMENTDRYLRLCTVPHRMTCKSLVRSMHNQIDIEPLQLYHYHFQERSIHM